MTINMPTELHTELRARATRRGITVTELLRRAVALEGVLFEDGTDAEVIIRRGGMEQTLRLI